MHFDVVHAKLKNLINRKKEKVANYSFANKVVGLYFSASWCQPCQAFTPILKSVYKQLKEKGKEFEIVLVSGDKEEEAFHKYLDTMPWLAIQFDDKVCYCTNWLHFSHP